MKLKIGISTCPNDTFIFGGMIRGDISHPFIITGIMDDVQLLNSLALKEAFDVIKVSFGVYNKIKDNYKILKKGGALGFGCGPLILSKKFNNIEELIDKKIAIPGVDTTAYNIFKLFYPNHLNISEVRFDNIMPLIESGEYDAGIVIHEGRFTFHKYGLKKLIDLGTIWEDKFNLPIPLGFIAVHKRVISYSQHINQAIHNSLDYAYNNQDKTLKYVKRFAKDIDDSVVKDHINLYVNRYSYNILDAKDAIFKLLDIDNSSFV